MKKPARSIQYTIRQVPVEVDRALRAKAKHQKQSLNQVVLDELSLAATGQIKRADFSDVVGKWVDDPEFDKVVGEQQRRIDPDLWR